MENRISIEVDPVKARVEQMGRTNWPLIVAFLGMIFGIVSGGWLIIGLKVEAQTAPLNIALEASRTDRGQLNERMRNLESASTSVQQQTSSSQTDRAQLNQRLQSVEARQVTNGAERRTNDTRQDVLMTELRTQFQNLNNVLNLYRDSTEQTLSILYAKVFPGDHLPPMGFRPALGK